MVFGDESRFAEMVHGVTEQVTNLGLSMIAEEFETYDELLRKRNILEVYMKALMETVILGMKCRHIYFLRNRICLIF